MVTLQDIIHTMEVGSGMRYLNRSVLFVLAVLGVLVVLVGYDLRAFRNLSTLEAMDSAQLARNLAQGRGYSTLFVRPLSIYLLENHNHQTNTTAGDRARLRTNHPDLANPPVYPTILAGLMKVLPFKFAIPTKSTPFWSPDGQFYRYQPDFLIALFNQFLLFGLLVSVFFLAKRLFDLRVAALSTLVLFGTELLWRFSISGLSTILLLLIFAGLFWCLVLLEEQTREPKWNRFALYALAAATGALVGLGCLTRYSFGWLVVPVILFVLVYTGRQRVVLAATLFLAFAVVLTPWVIRNYSLSGTPFGTATFALLENSALSREDGLERSLNPAILKAMPNGFPLLAAAGRIFWLKLVENGRTVLQSDLPKLGGTWLSAFFLVGLLVPFRSPRLGRLRWLLVASLFVLAVVQALGRTRLSENSPDINSENLLVLLTPWVVIYGVSLFFVLLDQAELPFFQLRPLAVGLFAAVMGLPLILTLLPPRANPIVYPPYYPPSIQTAVGWTKEDELLMSDVPWAVAWYGQSQCMWLTLTARADYYAVNDYLKPISALYLTPQTVDHWTQSGDWGNLFVQTLRMLPGDESRYPLRVNLTLPQRDGSPIAFPLKYLQAGWPMQLLFTCREHWPTSN